MSEPEKENDELIDPNTLGTGYQEDDIDEMLKVCIEQIWVKYDEDKNGILGKEEARKFILDILGEFFDSEASAMLEGDGFEKVFKKLDKDNSGKVNKDEMLEFI